LLKESIYLVWKASYGEIVEMSAAAVDSLVIWDLELSNYNMAPVRKLSESELTRGA
jgi:hypothetical protein